MTGAHRMTPRRLCSATSKRTGRQCGSTPPPGSPVCQWHGGAAPQVKKAAADRLAEMVDPALDALRKMVDEADSDAVRLSAVKDILDRAGYKPRDKVDVNVQTVKTIDREAWEAV